MKAVIVETPTFASSIEKFATAEELQELKDTILDNPEAGKLVVGGGGIRKIRFAIGDKGKSCGARAIYIYKNADDKIFLLVAYQKSSKSTLTKDELKILKKLAKEL